MCFSAVQLSVTTFVVAMLVEELGLGLVIAGTALAALQVAGVSGRMFWGWFADRIGNGNLTMQVTAVAATAGGVACLALGPGTPMVVIYGVLVLLGASAVAWNGVFQAEVARLAPSGQAANVTGAIMVPTFIGVFAGPPIFTAIQSATDSYTLAYALMAIGSVVGGVLVVRSRRAAG